MNLVDAQSLQTDFLSLLTLQLQNQDPIEPVQQEDLINNLTQFSILEGIQDLNASFEEVRAIQELSQGVNLVGKEVEYIDPITGEQVSGIADRIERSGTEIAVSVAGRSIDLANVISVAQP